MKNQFTVIGSGLAGPLISSILATKHDCNIEIYERSEDARNDNMFSGRSINLALSNRGIKALKYAGVYDDYFKSMLIPMHGRTIHTIDGKTIFQPYGNKKEHYINSVSRSEINKMLIEFAEKTKRVKFHFNMKCDKVDLPNNKIYFNGVSQKITSPIIGADGYRSVISQHISDLKNEKRDYVDIAHSYKELTINPKNNEYQMESNSLHIWPRRDMMMIALPNIDKSFTCTLFMKQSGENSFESIKTTEALYAFFEKYFPDALHLISDIENDFFKNPTGKLMGLKCPSWNYQDKMLSIGDAAHATVPFYGQGMNASFEDCFILSQIITNNPTLSWTEIFDRFCLTRKKDGDAILDLSLDNYRVMRSDVLDEMHIKKQNLSFILNKDFPDYFIPLYTMVSFTSIPYSIAEERGKIQEKILKILIDSGVTPENYNKQKASDLISKYLSKIEYNN